MIERTGNDDRSRNTVVVGARAVMESSRVGMVDGEVRMATQKSAVLRFLADGSVLINGTMMGSDAGVCEAVRNLFVEEAHLADPQVAELFSRDGLTAAEQAEETKFWNTHAIDETITLGPMALPAESGDIVMRNRRGQSLRVRPDGSCSSESMLLRPDQVVAHLRSLFSPTP